MSAAFLFCFGHGRCQRQGAESRVDKPFLGAYIHLPTWFRGKTDEAARERAIVENLDRFRDSGLRVLIPFVTTTGGQAEYAERADPRPSVGKLGPGGRDGPRGTQTRIAGLSHDVRAGLRARPALGHPQAASGVGPPRQVGPAAGLHLAGTPGGPEMGRVGAPGDRHQVPAGRHSAGLLPLPGQRSDKWTRWRRRNSRRRIRPISSRRAAPGTRRNFASSSGNASRGWWAQISGALRALTPKPRIAVYMWGAHELKGTRDWRTWADRGYLDMLNLTGYSYREQYGEKYLQVLDDRFRDVAAILKELPKSVEFTICVGIPTSHGKIREAREIEDYLQIGKRHGVQGAAIFTWETLQPYLADVKQAGYLEQFTVWIATARRGREGCDRPDTFVLLLPDFLFSCRGWQSRGTDDRRKAGESGQCWFCFGHNPRV